MFPNKIQHGDNLANLFEKFNTVIDYLREIRLVAGNGIRINRLPAGTTIESTATATGGTPTTSAAKEVHPFDAQIINKGTEENPQYYVRIFNSGFPDYPYAGWLYVGQYEFEIPATELAITTENVFFVWIIVAYDSTNNPPFDISLRLYPWGSSPPEYSSDTAWCETIAQGQLPVTLQTFYDSYIEVRGRWT